MKQKIIVTGGEGRFAKVLKDKNKSLNLIYASKKELNILNINSIKKFIKKHKPDTILHLAALSRPMKIHEKDISKSIKINIIGTANLVCICKNYDIKLIYFSTGYVYEGTRGNYKETDPVKPFNNYALSKFGGECAVQMYKNTLILRITMTEKPFSYNHAYSNLKSNYMFYEDLISILPKLIKKRGIINVGGPSRSIYSFVKDYNPNIKKKIAKFDKKLPLNQTMNLKILRKILQ